MTENNKNKQIWLVIVEFLFFLRGTHVIKRSETIENYINKKIVDLQERIPDNPAKIDIDAFDDVFRSILSDSIA